jgi:hypothetical protein
MEYRFEELCFAAPGAPDYLCGTLDPITVRWDCAHDWDAVLTEGITSIIIEVTRWPGNGQKAHTKKIDITEPTAANASPVCDLITYAVAQEIAERIDNDPSWYSLMQEEWTKSRAIDRECAAINAAWTRRKLELVSDNA